MSTSFRLPFCPHCNRLEPAVILANSALPASERIETIDVLIKHSLNNIPRNLFGGSEEDWLAPFISLDRPIHRRVMDSVVRSRGERILFWPNILGTKDSLRMIKNLQRRY